MTERNPVGQAALGVAFTGAVALMIVLTGPLLLFAPPFVSFMQARHDVSVRLGADPESVERATAAMLRDLVLDGDFTVSLDGTQPVLDAAERSHMQDVGVVVRGLGAVEVISIAVALLAGRRLGGNRRRRGRLLLLAALTVGGLAALLGAVFVLAFDVAFTAFHLVFFPGGNWQFPPSSNLIRFFPAPMWYELAMVAGAAMVLSAALVLLLARRDLAASSD
jgi:hypothetical protein